MLIARTRYAYDALERLIRVTDPAGNETACEYDALNRPLWSIVPTASALTRFTTQGTFCSGFEQGAGDYPTYLEYNSARADLQYSVHAGCYTTNLVKTVSGIVQVVGGVILTVDRVFNTAASPGTRPVIKQKQLLRPLKRLAEKIAEYAERYGVEYIIDIIPLGIE